MFSPETKFGILGAAKSGIAAAYKLKELGFLVFLSEYESADNIAEAEMLQADLSCEFGGHSDRILDSDIIVVSPGIPLNVPILQQAREKDIELISEIELGYLIKHEDSKIIAITGSNGKSTTVSLIHQILKTAGINSILAGNIGAAFTSFPIEKPGIDFIVLELSSFQLDLIKTFRANVAAILNVTPDHLNRYDSFQDYALAKFKIFINQTAADLAIINLDDEIVTNFEKRVLIEKLYFSMQEKEKADIFLREDKIIYGENELLTSLFPIQGPHNVANIMAAILSVTPFNISLEIIKKAISEFKSLAHRLEFVADIGGIRFYNDSKATNTESVKFALQSFSQPIRIIMGGAGKGEDYTVLNDLLRKNAAKIYLLGEARDEMAEAFEGITELELFDDFRSAVEEAYRNAITGDIVVLSPACTSYDMFNNFEERGEYFKKVVQELSNGK